MSVRDRERKRGVRDDSRSPPFTLLIADIIPVQTWVSEEVNGSEHRLLLFSVILHTDFSFLIRFIIPNDEITGWWNFHSIQSMCHGDILNLRHCWTSMYYSIALTLSYANGVVRVKMNDKGGLNVNTFVIFYGFHLTFWQLSIKKKKNAQNLSLCKWENVFQHWDKEAALPACQFRNLSLLHIFW